MDPIDYGRFEDGRHVNYYDLDYTIRREVARVTPRTDYDWADEQLRSFGQVVGDTIADNADLIDEHGPILHTYDRDGEVRNFVEYHPKQFENERLAYGAGIVSDSFEAPPGRDDPLPLTHHLAMEYLLSYADPGFTCPVSMTAGTALVLDKYGEGEVLQEYYERLVARDGEENIEGAMFLTEKQGGSDVGANETIAEHVEGDRYELTGEKWFCSNIDAEGTLALARTPDAPEGTKGLSLFLVPHTVDGELNSQLYRRLKDKLGTISVPTGEVELQGATGYLVGEEQRGFKYMTDMLNLERLSNASASVAIMGRCLLEAKIHAANREAFGSPIQEYPLMKRDLVDMAVDHEAAVAYTFEAGRVLSRRERDGDEDAYRLMRVLVPIAKSRTARMSVDTASYAMEILGGNGYVKDFVTHRLLRDAQVLPIWEGTSNILALDVLRALDREDAHEPLLEAIQSNLDAAEHPVLADTKESIQAASADLGAALATLATEDGEYAQLQAKELADYIFDVFTGSLLLAEAQSQIDEADDARLALVAERFVDRHLREHDSRGITSGDRFALEHFDAVVRYESVDPETLLESAPADD
ncbi:acyl-CoA dehydrogenase family protein [Haloarchaeobius sp. HME9146]|uniref:acyl-CoA dehydrogenase family protein n=1 Tax=Haloarchaeobius sp. HME9146 TaxID=2978732 RepID=UPI0021BEC330|nr:acyl-CoA dehydrogenase family protein [Haloarchaeobius sp. HME9146]MCT9096558.1 acyl-CoA dehydrogenase family protein [Haloarchaeobius sp. HME9146]